MLFVCISDDCLMEIFEMSRIYVGNECIEMKCRKGFAVEKTSMSNGVMNCA